MAKIIGIWEQDFDEYGEYVPYVYTDDHWERRVAPYVYYDGQWQQIGGANTLMIPFLTSEGEYFYTSDGKKFLVRNHSKRYAYVSSVDIIASPNKTVYNLNDYYNNEGLVVQLTIISRGRIDTTLVTQYNWPHVPLTVGQTSVPVTCTYLNGQSSVVNVPITVVEPQVSISVTTPPNRTAYLYKEIFNPAGMVVTATVTTVEGTQSYPVINYTYTTNQLDVTDHSVSINWTYIEGYGASTTQAISVRYPNVSIQVDIPPNRTSYDINDLFDPTGMTIRAIIETSNGTRTQLVNNYTYTPTTGLTTSNTAINISWTYDGVVTATTTQAISVIVPTATLRVVIPPTKTYYQLNEVFDPTGMVVEATTIDRDGTTIRNISDYTYDDTPMAVSWERKTETISWTFKNYTATTSTPIITRIYNLNNTTLTASQNIDTAIACEDNDKSFTIAYDLRLTADAGSWCDIFSEMYANIEGEEWPGLIIQRADLLEVTNKMRTSWGDATQLLDFYPSTSGTTVRMVLRHIANSNNLLINYNINGSPNQNTITLHRSTFNSSPNTLLINASYNREEDGTQTIASSGCAIAITNFSIINDNMDNNWVFNYIHYNQLKNTSIPAAYEELEYIESSGTQWIDTGIIPTATTTADIKFMNLVLTGAVIFGHNGAGSDTADWRVFNNSGTLYFDMPGGSSAGNRLTAAANTCPVNTIQEFELGNFYVRNLKTNVLTASGNNVANFTSTVSLRLNYTSAGTHSRNKWYYVDIWDDGQLKASLVPAKRISDGEIGMYDKVSGTFLTNQGTDAFLGHQIKPNFTLPSAYQSVEYIESSGTQWIDTGIIPTNSTLSRIKFMPLVVEGGVIFGHSGTSDTTDYRLFNSNSAFYFDLPGGSSAGNRVNGGSCPVNAAQEIELDDFYIRNLATDTTIASGSIISFTSAKTLTLNYSERTSGITTARWYYADIWDEGVLVSSLVPCYRKSDNVIGMYDFITQTLLTNQGTGKFIIGPYNNGNSAILEVEIPVGQNSTSVTITNTTLNKSYTCTGSLSSNTTTNKETFVFTIPSNEFGTWNITIVADEVTYNNNDPIVINTANIYHIDDIPKPTIKVTYPAGFTCTIDNGVETRTAPNTNGYAEFLVEQNEEWMVHCYKNGLERSKRQVNSGNGLSDIPVTLSEWITFTCPDAFEMVSGDGSVVGWDGTIQYSIDGSTWSTWDGTTAIASSSTGDEKVLYVRGSNNTVVTGLNSTSTAQGWHFNTTDIAIYGNIATLLDYQTVDSGSLPTLGQGAFQLWLAWGVDATNIASTYLIHSYGLILPWTTLTTSCYKSMLQGNHHMVDAPDLPATILAEECYNGMFQGCFALQCIPTIAATSFATSCCTTMFNACYKIKLSTTATGDYVTEYQIVNNGEATVDATVFTNMFANTGGTFTGTPTVDTVYYIANDIGGVRKERTIRPMYLIKNGVSQVSWSTRNNMTIGTGTDYVQFSYSSSGWHAAYRDINTTEYSRMISEVTYVKINSSEKQTGPAVWATSNTSGKAADAQIKQYLTAATTTNYNIFAKNGTFRLGFATVYTDVLRVRNCYLI